MSTALQKNNESRFSVAIQKDEYQKLIRDTLAEPRVRQRFIANITTVVANTPALQDANPGSIISGALLAESLGLSMAPMLGYCYLVPFTEAVKGADGKKIYLLDQNGNHILDENKRWKFKTEKKAQFIMGYTGFIQLAIRSGVYKKISAFAVKEGEIKKKLDPMTEDMVISFIDDEDERDAAPTCGYVAWFETKDGYRKVMYMSHKKMVKHADKYSPAFSASAYEKIQSGDMPQKEMWKYSSPWYTDFDMMGCKTMLRRLLKKWGPTSTTDTKLSDAIMNDNCVGKDDGSFSPIRLDDVPKTPLPIQDDPDVSDIPDISEEYADDEEIDFDEL
ncbi:MAG: recombinase RecT [bacterium]|nr:recombinase RecT [bacterium]